MRSFSAIYSRIYNFFTIIFEVILKISHFVFQPIPDALNYDNTDVLNYIEYFSDNYGYFHPDFLQTDYVSAVEHVKETLSYLVIYLHGDDHEDSERFCREVLCSSEVVVYFRERKEIMKVWSVNINSAEGCRVSKMFQEHSYPFIGFVCLRNNGRVYLTRRHEGYLDAAELIQFLESSVREFGEAVRSFRRLRYCQEPTINTPILNGAIKKCAQSMILSDWLNSEITGISLVALPTNHNPHDVVTVRANLPQSIQITHKNSHILTHQFLCNDSIKLIFYWLLVNIRPTNHNQIMQMRVQYRSVSTTNQILQLNCVPMKLEKPDLVNFCRTPRETMKQLMDPLSFEDSGFVGGSKLILLIDVDDEE